MGLRLVVAVGGNALILRHQRPDAGPQLDNVRTAAAAIAPLIDGNEVIVTHGNGPQVGMLSLESSADPALREAYPLDALVAETQGLIGYWLANALQNERLDRDVCGLVTRSVVDHADPAFGAPSKFVGPMLTEAAATALTLRCGWTVGRDGDGWRRTVASPEPLDVLELPLIERLVGSGAVVVCAGGGGIPVAREPNGSWRGIEAVIDKDSTSALIAERMNADVLLFLTDVSAVFDGFGTPAARPIRSATPTDLRSGSFEGGSMGPKVAAACRFVERTGKAAAIGALADARAILAGEAGTLVTMGGLPNPG